MGSLDPVEHDALNSTIIFKNVYPRLINLGTDGAPAPFLASSWQISPDRLEWNFVINPSAKFENDEPITSEVVAKNLKRILWLTRNDKTQLQAKLVGFAQWVELTSPLEGIQWSGQIVTLRFKDAPEELFETLDQAIYGVIPLQEFDAKSGKFKGVKAISGGYYRIDQTSTDYIRLLKNPNWKTSGPREVIVRWDTFDLNDVGELEKKYDLVITNGMNFTDNFRKRKVQDDFAFVVAPHVSEGCLEFRGTEFRNLPLPRP